MADWRNRLEQIQNKFKFQLNAKGIDNITQLAKAFKVADEHSQGHLSRLDLEQLFSNMGVFLSTQELRHLFDRFQSKNDNLIAYSDFINFVRSNMSDDRLNIVRNAWNHVSKGAHSLPLQKVIDGYNPTLHPRVISREKNVDVVFKDFCDAISSLALDGQVSDQAFLMYYENLNACLPAEKETYFIDLVNKTWGLQADKTKIDPNRMRQLELTIFEKIRQKTHGADDEGKTLKRIFKHFDQENYGTVNQPNFQKALETIGCVFTQEEMNALFQRFDLDKNGKVDFIEMSSWVARIGSGNSPNVNPVFGATRDAPNSVLQKIKAVLQSKGLDLSDLRKLFRRSDKNGNGELDRQEFQWVLKEAGQVLGPSEFEKIFKFFDKNNNGSISYHEFVETVRGPLSDQKTKVINTIADKYFQAGQNTQPIQQLFEKFDLNAVHQVKNGHISKDQYIKSVLDVFQGEGFSHEGQISKEQFIDFLSDKASMFKLELQFEQHFNSMFRIY